MGSPTMAAVLLAGPTLFGAGPLRALSRRRSAVDGGQVVLYLMIAAMVIAGVCLAVYFASRVAHRRRYNSHGSLFSGLCRTHGLDRVARKLLRQVAHHHNVIPPGRLFTEPQWLDPTRLRGSMRQYANQVTALRHRLFAKPGRPTRTGSPPVA